MMMPKTAIIKSKKVKLIASIVIIVYLCIMLLFTMAYIVNKIPYNEIAFTITECKVEDFTQDDIDIGSTMGYELPKEITENMDRYSVIRLDYNIQNNSNKIEMQDMRCHPSFDSKLNDNIISYNSGNGTYYIYNYPKSCAGFLQYIIVKKDNMDNEDIYELVCEGNIKLTFYVDGVAGMFRKNKGHGFEGSGKYTYKFKISDCLIENGNK